MAGAMRLLLGLLHFAFVWALRQKDIPSDYYLGSLEERLGDNVHAMGVVNVQPLSQEEEKSVRVLCWVNTYHKNHADRVGPIRKTWGKKCDKIVFMSDVYDEEFATVPIAAPPLHDLLWQKHREVVRTLIREYDEGDFDWIFKCDDDTFVVMENLKKFLLSPEVTQIPTSEPTILGHRMTLQWWEMERKFHPFRDQHPEHVKIMKRIKKETIGMGGLFYTPGGGGYAMNWAYIRLLAQSFDEPYCLPDMEVPDDWAISFCMRQHNVRPRDTRDAEKRERFHQYDPVKIYFREMDTEAYDHALFKSIYQENNWFSDHYGIGWKNGSDCCAPDTVSFHYVKPPLMLDFNEYYYGVSAYDLNRSEIVAPFYISFRNVLSA